MASLSHRLSALEAGAGRVRRPDLIAGHVDRLLAIDRKEQAWPAGGVSCGESVRRCAVEIGRDSETFARELAETWERETGCAAW